MADPLRIDRSVLCRIAMQRWWSDTFRLRPGRLPCQALKRF